MGGLLPDPLSVGSPPRLRRGPHAAARRTQVGQFSGVWRGAAAHYWQRRPDDVVADPGGRSLSQRSPRRDGSGPAVGPSRSAPTGRLTAPASMLQPLVDVDMPIRGRGSHLQPDRRAVQRRTLPANRRRLRWQQARLHSRSAALELARLMAPSAVRWTPWRLTLPSGLSSAEPQRPGICRPMALSVRGALRPRQDAPLLAAGHAPDNGTPRPGSALRGKWLPQNKNDDTLAALSLHFPFVWYGFLLLFGTALGSTCVDLSSAAHVDPDRGRRADNPPAPESSCPQCRQPIALAGQYPLRSSGWAVRRIRAPIA